MTGVESHILNGKKRKKSQMKQKALKQLEKNINMIEKLLTITNKAEVRKFKIEQRLL
jgi:hypothetical protein